MHQGQSQLYTAGGISIEFQAEQPGIITTHFTTSSLAKMAAEEVIHAYRHLYRAALRAVCFSQPASTVARDQLRRAFRDKTRTFNKSTIRRTVWFLNNAARETGTEHKIVKSLLFTQWCREKNRRLPWKHITDPSYKKKECVACPF